MAARDTTNTGVHYGLMGSTTVLVGASQTMTFTLSNHGCIFIVNDVTVGRFGIFAASYDSATITELHDPAGAFEVTDTGSVWAVFKSASSQVISIKNRTVGSLNIIVAVLGRVASATAPA